MITPGKNRNNNNETFPPPERRERDAADEQENAELFQFDKTGNLSVRYLRESYNAAKARASELNTNAGLSGNLRSYCQQTIRVYSALATLLYSTISISKADDLERFVRKRSLQVPNSLFDIDEWKPVLQIARNVRMGESGKYLDELGAFKSFMKLRLERILTGSRFVVSEYKRMKADTAKELDALKKNMEDVKYKVLPYLQQKVTKLSEENYKLARENKLFRDAGIAKDMEIKELTRSKAALEHEHASHVERVKKESFEAIAFAKSKIETQQSAHRSEVSSLNRQHEAKVLEMQKSFDAQTLHNSVTSKEVIDRLTTEREWLQKTHSAVLENAEKVQQQFKAQCDNEVARLEKRYAEAEANASSRLANEASNTAQLLQSSAATYEAKLSSANAAREYETNMLQVKLDAMENTLKDTQLNLEKARQQSEDLSTRLVNGEAELIAKRSELDNMKDRFDSEKKQHEALKESTDAELERLRLQLDELFNEKSAMTIEMGVMRAERDDVEASKKSWNKQMDALAFKERTLRQEHEEQTRVVTEMESEKCRLMSYYDEMCQQSDAQKKEIAALKQDKEIVRRKQIVKDEENQQLMNDLEADKSRLMGYYDEKCLQSDNYKKRIQQKETQIIQMRKDFRQKEIEGMNLMNEIEADKSRLMGYYDEKCLQIGSYKKQLASFEKTIKKLQEGGGDSGGGDGGGSHTEIKEELASFQKQMSQRELKPVNPVNNAKKDATDMVAAVSRVIAEYTISRCLTNAMEARKSTSSVARVVKSDENDAVDFVTSQYAGHTVQSSNADDVQKINELEATLSKKNNDLHALIADNEAKQAEIQSLKSKLLSADTVGDKSASEIDLLKDKINDLTKENYYSAAEITKLSEQLLEHKNQIAEAEKVHATAASASEFNAFSVGDKVMGNFGGEGDWFPGTIRNCHGGGIYDIFYDDGDTEKNVIASNVKAQESADSAQLATELQETKEKLQSVEAELVEAKTKVQNLEASADRAFLSSPFAVGDKVMGNFGGEGDWFPGTIRKCHGRGMYDILYDDGDSEANVDASCVKAQPESSQPSDGTRLASLEKELQETKQKLQNVEMELADAKSELQTMIASAHSTDLTAKVAAADLAEYKVQAEKLNNKNQLIIKEKDASLASQEETISHLRKLVSDLKGSKDQLESQLNEMKSDPALNAKIEKLQAITRGFNARARVKRTKMHRDAQTSGVLVATKHTTQGDSGWYCAPDGSLYYFVLDGDEWILTCGPITREAFEDTVLNLKPKKVSSTGYLKLSNFDLVTQTVDQPGDLYMSTSTWKLYFAVSVDHLVTENR